MLRVHEVDCDACNAVLLSYSDRSPCYQCDICKGLFCSKCINDYELIPYVDEKGNTSPDLLKLVHCDVQRCNKCLGLHAQGKEKAC